MVIHVGSVTNNLIEAKRLATCSSIVPASAMWCFQTILYSDRDEGPSAMEMLTQQMQQLQATIDSMQRSPKVPAPGVKPHFRGAFMAQSSNYEQWLPSNPAQGGFAFDDSYSSDVSSVMLAANPSKRLVRPSFTPLGLVPSAYIGKALRARPSPAPAPPPRHVPASANRQERMR